MTFSSVRILGFLFLFTCIHYIVSEETAANDATVNVKPTETTEIKTAEEVTPATEETSKPTEEAPKPADETVKVEEETAKVAEETAKPSTDAQENDASSAELEETSQTADNTTDEDDFSNEMEETLVRLMEEYASGKLNKSEMDKHFQDYRSKIQQDIQESFEANKNEVWANLGKKPNDTVSWEEYVKLSYPPESIPKDEKLEDLIAPDKEKFDSHDSDKDGKLTFEEFQSFFANVMDSKMPDFSFEKMMQDFMGNETEDSLKEGPEELGDDLEDDKKEKLGDTKSAEEGKATVEETKTDAAPHPAEEKKEETKTETTNVPSEGTEAKREEL